MFQFLFLLRYKNWIWLITFPLFIMLYIKLTTSCQTIVFSQDSTSGDIQDNSECLSGRARTRTWTSLGWDVHPSFPFHLTELKKGGACPEAGLCCRSINKVPTLPILTYVWCLQFYCFLRRNEMQNRWNALNTFQGLCLPQIPVD